MLNKYKVLIARQPVFAAEVEAADEETALKWVQENAGCGQPIGYLDNIVSVAKLSAIDVPRKILGLDGKELLS